MAITDKEQGVWNLDEVYNKINQGGIWDYTESFALWTWGANQNGSLGLNQAHTTKISSPVLVPGGNWAGLWNGKASARDYVYASKNANEFWSWGSNTYGSLGLNQPINTRISSPTQVPGSWSNVEVGFYGGLGVKTNGGLFTWGYNSDGQLGQNNGTPYSSPTQVGSDTTWSGSSNNITQGGYAAGALKTNGTLWTWGENQSGELGHNNKTKESSPKQVGTNTTWSTISIGGGNAEGHTIALKTDGTAWAWGHNTNGTLGQNNTTQYSSPKQIPGTTWARVQASSGRYSWGVKTDGTLWTWGQNDTGALGHNNRTNYSSPKQVPGTTWDKDKICAEGEAIGAVKTDGTLWTWGGNDDGWLGQNIPDNTRRSSPTQVPGTDWVHIFVRSKGMAALRLP
jgi:alpha-tubulin suppressor-like RCC1 family protein